MHAHWILFLQRFNFVFKYRAGRLNQVADALSRRTRLLAYSPTRLLIVVKTVIIGFDTLPELNAEDRFFCYLETMLEP